MGNQLAIGTRDDDDDIYISKQKQTFQTLISKRIKLKCYKDAAE